MYLSQQSHATEEQTNLNEFLERHRPALQQPQQPHQPQQPNLFVSLQSKPKVSSPAPSKIYGRPGSLSTAQTKIGAEIGINSAQDRTFSGKCN